MERDFSLAEPTILNFEAQRKNTKSSGLFFNFFKAKYTNNPCIKKSLWFSKDSRILNLYKIIRSEFLNLRKMSTGLFKKKINLVVRKNKMINQIIEKFISQILENINGNLSEIISAVFKFSNQISEAEKTILKNEIVKILPLENSTSLEKEIFAVLFSIGNNSRQLKKIGFSDPKIKEAFTDYFDKAQNSDFIQSLQNYKS